MQLKELFPWAYAESVFEIDYYALYRSGYRGLIFDIDNTLVHHGEDATREIERLFQLIHETGFKTMLLSDNDEERVRQFARNMDTDWISDAEKPAPKACLQAVKRLGLKKEEVLVIGDQMFKDILCANRAGVPSIMVHFTRKSSEKWIGKRRYVEFLILGIWRLTPYSKRLRVQKRKLFCEMNPVFYRISQQKEMLKRHLLDLCSKEKFAKEISGRKLPCVLAAHSNLLIKTGKGIDPVLQKNKAINLNIACNSLNGLIIHPGETFSLWHVIGKPSSRRGYKKGRIIVGNKMIPGVGGGLCNLGNTIHWLVLHSPMKVTEVHWHSDALAPDHGKREPLSAGTSVGYNYIDFRFQNNTDQNMQLCFWCDETEMHGELRSGHTLPYRYEIEEEDHHFSKENGKYFRISKIYVRSIDIASGRTFAKRLIRDNHSEVMFDESQIPEELIRVHS